jgi:hypothetical protein
MGSRRITVLTLLLLVVVVGTACVNLAGDCSNSIKREVLSPNGKMKAVIFGRDCGATVGFNTQVSVLPSSSKLPNDGGNVFVADGGSGKEPAGPAVSVSWTNDSELLVTYDKSARVFHNEPSIGNVRVKYQILHAP